MDSNVTVVNAMYAELLDAPEIAPNALRSYYVDFYLTQALAGGFAQYVFTVPGARRDRRLRPRRPGRHGRHRPPGAVQPHRRGL